MSYVAHKSRLFRDSGDAPEVVRKRSEGRMKTYPSTIDARAWCIDGEDRRQHILDLIKSDHEKCALGKYVPIEVLIDTLMANKNADIARLRAQVEELQKLLDMYLKLDLTEDQKRMLLGLTQEINRAGDELDELTDKSETKSPRDADSEGETGGITESDTDEILAVATRGVTGFEGTDGTEGITDDSGAAGIDSSDGIDSTGGVGAGTGARSTCAALAREQTTCAANARGATPRAAAPSPVSYDGLDASQLKAICINKDDEIVQLANALNEKQEECNQQYKIARAAIEQLETLRDIMEERDSLKQQLEESLHQLKTLKDRVEDPCLGEISALESEIERLRSSGQLSADEEAEVIRKEVEVLKKYCAKLSSIQEENHKLKTQMQRIQELSGIPSDSDDDSDLPNDPTELKNRLKDLRRKFVKLGEIMDERDKFRMRVQQLEGELLKYGDLPEEIEIFRQRSQMLDDVLGERDNLQKRLERLRGIEEELIVLKRKADRVDQLERQLDSMNGEVGNIRRASALELHGLKTQKEESGRECECIKAERDMLRMKVADMATVDEEMERLRYRAKEAEVLRIERDRMKMRLDELAAIEVEYMQLLDRTRCIETIKAERQLYKQKYEELLGLECECDMLRAQIERFKILDKEREALLRQVRDCECCIADQEDEIKKLVAHIDLSSHGSNQHQDRMQKALTDMRAELEQKTCLIANSEEQLAGVQDQLKSTIAGVSCESSCLRARIEELEEEVELFKAQLREKDAQVEMLKTHLGEKDSMLHSLNQECDSRGALLTRSQNELDRLRMENERMGSRPATFEGDQHFQTMLKQSKCAVRKVCQELGKQYEEWDTMKGRMPDQRPELREEERSYRQMQVQEGTQKDEPTVDKGVHEELLEKYREEKRNSIKLADDVQELQSQVQQSEQKLVQATQCVAQLREEVIVSERLVPENMALRRHSTEVQEVAKEQIEELVDHLKRAKERIAELEAQNAAFLQAAGGVAPPPLPMENCDALKEQIESLESERNKLTKLVEQFQQDLSGAGPDVGALRLEIATLEEQLEKETKLRQEAEARLTSKNTELSCMTDNIQESVRRNTINESELQAEVLKLRAENEQLKENMKSVGENAARRTSIAADEVDVFAGQSMILLREKVALESENASLVQQVADLKQQLENLRSGGDNAEIEALRQENEALLAKIAELTDVLQKLTAGQPVEIPSFDDGQLERERKEKEELQNMIKTLQGQISTMEQGGTAVPPPVDTSELDAVVANLRAQLEKEQAKAAAAEANFQQLLAASAEGGELPVFVPPPSDDSALLEEIANLKARVKQLEGETANLQQLLAASAAGGEIVLPPPVDTSELDALVANLRAQLEKEQAKAAAAEANFQQLLAASAEGGELPVFVPPPSDDSALLEEIANLKARVKQLEGEAAEAGSASYLLKEKLAMMETKVQELEVQNTQLAAAAGGDDSGLYAQINDLKQKIKELEIENLDLKGKLARADTEIAGIRRMSKEMASDHTSQMKRLSKTYENRIKQSSQTFKMAEQAINLGDEDRAAVEKMKQGYENRIKKLENELESQRKQCADTIASLKSQCDRDMKNINNKYNDGIVKLQVSHEEILKDVGKEHEKEVENLRTELRSSIVSEQKSRFSQTPDKLSMKTVENVNIKPGKKASVDLTKKGAKGVCTCGGGGLDAILHQILDNGIESLTYEELHFLHTKVCEASCKIRKHMPPPPMPQPQMPQPQMPQPQMPQPQMPPPQMPPPQMPLPRMPIPQTHPTMDVDKLCLMKRVSGLEGDLMRKQKHAQQKVGGLQIAVQMERQRLEELKQNLELEKSRNCELMCKLGAQSRAVANMQVERELLRKQSSFHEEKLQELMLNCDDERSRCKSLEHHLQKAKSKQTRDADALESMRIKLEKSLNNEIVLKMQLHQNTAGSPSPQTATTAVVPCACSHPDGAPPAPAHQSRTSSFYTELTVQDVRNKRNFVHHCCMKQRDQPGAGNVRNKRSSSVQPTRHSETDK